MARCTQRGREARSDAPFDDIDALFGPVVLGGGPSGRPNLMPEATEAATGSREVHLAGTDPEPTQRPAGMAPGSEQIGIHATHRVR